MSKLRLIFLIILIQTGFFQCSNDYPIPEVYVNFIIQLTAPTYQPLTVPGNSVYIPNEGNRGLIVTRINNQEFAAYDRTCTYDPQDPEGIVEINEISGICKKCSSKFSLLLNGLVETGPAGLPLKTYVVEFNPNAQTLLIHN